MTVDPQRHVVDIFQSAVERVRPRTVIPENLELDSGRIRIGRNYYDLPDAGIYAIAIGKASVPMMSATEQVLGDRLERAIAVTKSTDGSTLHRTAVYVGSHPVPDQNSIEAGRAVRDFARSVPRGALVLCLISGGGSALVELPRDGVSLATIGETTGKLLRAGASIHELNAVRSRMSGLKSGGLLAELAHTQVHNVIISDVLGDDPATIASGLTTPPADSLRAEDVLAAYGVQLALPKSILQDLIEPTTVIAANLGSAIGAAVERASSIGYSPVILSGSLEGEAREVAGVLASVVADTARGRTSFVGRIAILAGGETTVTVQGDGIGGRNTECALAAAIKLEGIADVAVGFLATDGDDGMAEVAGAIVTGDTIRPDNRREARQALQENDSSRFLDAAGATWGPGPTGTNVNDLVIALVETP